MTDTGQIHRRAAMIKLVEHLDEMIGKWREQRDTTKLAGDFVIARCYVDAFQAVRQWAVGESLPHTGQVAVPESIRIEATGFEPQEMGRIETPDEGEPDA